MLQAYINDNWVPIINRSNYYIDHSYEGHETLSFSLSVNDELSNLLVEEMQVKEDLKNIYILKKINRLSSSVTYDCELDLSDFKKNVYKSTKDEQKFITKSLGEILTAILPSGWKHQNAGIRTIKRTIELECATDYDILFKCEEIFDIVYRIDTLNRIIYVIDPETFEDRGIYIHRDLNLKSYTMKGDSSSLITRIYAEGKDGMTFESINGGKNYLENLEYQNKVISAFWKDERYTDKQSLLDDCKKKLSQLSIPSRSYVFNVIDLASVDEKYHFLGIDMYYPVKVIVNENLSLMSRVIKYREYIDDNEKNKNIVTLSNEPQTINQKINNAFGGNINNTVNGSFLEQAKKEATAVINDFATKGYRYETENEIYFLDKLPKEAAKCVMRMNLGGIGFSTNGWAGPYVTAWTIDGRFNADFISTGTLKAIRIEAAEIVGGSININDVFKVDENGKVTLRKGYLNIADKFIVDENGNLTVTGNGKFTGDISGSKIVGSTVTSESGVYKVIVEDGIIKWINTQFEYQLNFNPTVSMYINYDDSTYKDDVRYSGGTLSSNATIHTKEQLHVEGNIHGNQDIHVSNNAYARAFKQFSDKRLKENIKSIDLSGLFDYLNIYEFNFIGEDKKQVGVLAQDFIGTPYENIILSKNDKGLLSVDYNVILMAVAQLLKKVKK